jgi:hypothetical protein
MIDRLINIGAWLCPTGKAMSTGLSPGDEQSTRAILKKLQLKLDQALKEKYEQKAQTCFDNKLSGERRDGSVAEKLISAHR